MLLSDYETAGLKCSNRISPVPGVDYEHDSGYGHKFDQGDDPHVRLFVSGALYHQFTMIG